MNMTNYSPQRHFPGLGNQGALLSAREEFRIAMSPRKDLDRSDPTRNPNTTDQLLRRRSRQAQKLGLKHPQLPGAEGEPLAHGPALTCEDGPRLNE